MGGRGGSYLTAVLLVACALMLIGVELIEFIVEQTNSYRRVFPPSILERYAFAEVRNAAATLAGTNPAEFDDIVAVLDSFRLTLASLTDAGKNKGTIASTLDEEFRKRGWREAGYKSETSFTMRIEPYKAVGEREARVQSMAFHGGGHKIDNVHGRVALDVEWNAKDGNLDRDLANFRALHEVAMIDVGVLLTRVHERTKWAANYLADAGNVARTSEKTGRRIILLGTTTTTNLEKLIPRLERGDAGGCPVLAIAITERCYEPGPGDPALPSYQGPLPISGEPAADVEDEDGEESVGGR